jgi:hypothetical protein
MTKHLARQVQDWVVKCSDASRKTVLVEVEGIQNVEFHDQTDIFAMMEIPKRYLVVYLR